MAGQQRQEPFGPGNLACHIGRIKSFSGLLLIILSFILAKVAIPVLSIDLYLSLFMYAISWAMFSGGIAMCGKGGWRKAKSLAGKFGKRITRCLMDQFTG